MAINYIDPPLVSEAARTDSGARARVTDLSARGEPFTWALGGALALGIMMIVGFLLMVVVNGAVTFWPKQIAVVTLKTGDIVAGEPFRSEAFRPPQSILQTLPADVRAGIEAADGFARRTLYRTGNFDLYNEDFRWVADYEVARIDNPGDVIFAERTEWGPFVGRIDRIVVDGRAVASPETRSPELLAQHAAARDRWARIRKIERSDIGAVNHDINAERLAVRRAELEFGAGSPDVERRRAAADARIASLQKDYDRLSGEAAAIREQDRKVQIVLKDAAGKGEKTLPLSAIVRFYPANDLSTMQALGVYLSRWWEFLSDEPREANTEGGVFPAIFGTFAMTLLLVLVVTPFGVVTALYLREYAKQGRLVSIIRISVNNLAGVPSIVYGVFGLGFFAYIFGGSIDQLFFPERLPNPTFGTGGLLWASLTLAILTVPVVIVATEEALAAVPRSMREGSLACGASKWQTIRNIVLPRAMPGIMTGIILAMARGAGEVAPLMLVGVVKLAPELPIDGFFPFVHLERSFMHLGFHIYDVGFQSRNSEAGKPMVFVTTLLLVGLIFAMNLAAIVIRNRLKRKFAGSQF